MTSNICPFYLTKQLPPDQPLPTPANDVWPWLQKAFPDNSAHEMPKANAKSSLFPQQAADELKKLTKSIFKCLSKSYLYNEMNVPAVHNLGSSSYASVLKEISMQLSTDFRVNLIRRLHRVVVIKK